MTIKLGSNIDALRAARQLDRTSASTASVFERLASGMRINHASDDAAGLSVATTLSAQAKIFGAAIRNLNDGLSVVNIADDALGSLSDISSRLKELATQSANGTYSLQQRGAMDEEADALVDEYNRVLSSTTFNGVNLFDGSQSQVVLQAGIGSNATLTVGLTPTTSTSYVGDGTFTAPYSQVVTNGGGSPRGSAVSDFNGDGKLDIVVADDQNSRAVVMLGAGDGTFSAGASYSTQGRVYSVVTGDFNGDGSMDFATADHFFGTSVFLNNGDGTFRASATVSIGVVTDSIAAGDINGDGVLDLVVPQQYAGALTVLIGNGNGTFKSGVNYTAPVGSGSVTFADVNGDGRLDIVAGGPGNGTVNVLIGNGNGSFSAALTINFGLNVSKITVGDFNDDGRIDIAAAGINGVNAVKLMLGNGDGTFRQGASIATQDSVVWALAQGDFNSDGFTDLTVKLLNGTNNRVGVLFGNGDGSFRTISEIPNFGASVGGGNASFITIGDFNGDGVDDISQVDGIGRLTVSLTNSRHSLRLQRLNLNTRGGALGALSVLDKAQQNVLELRSQLGSSGSRVHVALNTLAVTRENYLAAESRIKDADIASDAAQMVRLQILQQAGAAILASANQQPALALKLLG